MSNFVINSYSFGVPCDETTYTWTSCGTDSDNSLKTDWFVGARILASNTLVGTTVIAITGSLKNPSSISGTCVLKCYASDNTLKATSATVNNSSIGTGYGTVTFDTFSWSVVAGDYFLVSTDTGSSMKILYSVDICSAYTNINTYNGVTHFNYPQYDWVGTATYCA